MVWIIGDIHGEKELLKKIIPIINKEDMYCVGDVIDRGPDSIGCIDLCIENNIKVVKGNHEDMALDYYFEEHRYDEGLWFSNGGDTTFKEILTLIRKEKAAEFAEKKAKKYIDWMLNLPLYYKLNNFYLICHGGINKHLEDQCKGKTPDILWRRKDIYHQELFQVVGHTPKSSPTITAHYANIDTGAHFSGKLSAIHLPSKEVVTVR